MQEERKREIEEEGEVIEDGEDAEGEPEVSRDRIVDGKIKTYFTKC